MAYIYAMSDIHGEFDIFKEALKFVNLTGNIDNKLILLGDYIDRGYKSCETLYYIKDLQEKFPKQVIVLRGNHEDMFLQQLYENNEFDIDYYNEMQNYLSEDDLDNILKKFENLSTNALIDNVYKEMVILIKSKHKALIKWLKELPYYYETEKQIYVHAGVDERCGEDWKACCENDYLIWKYPYDTGRFYKDIIAGHISIEEKVFWDGESHYYIDGNSNKSKIIPVLKYDTSIGEYSSFEKIENSVWREYIIV